VAVLLKGSFARGENQSSPKIEENSMTILLNLIIFSKKYALWT
jgi:hypothetical protein